MIEWREPIRWRIWNYSVSFEHILLAGFVGVYVDPLLALHIRFPERVELDTQFIAGRLTWSDKLADQHRVLTFDDGKNWVRARGPAMLLENTRREAFDEFLGHSANVMSARVSDAWQTLFEMA